MLTYVEECLNEERPTTRFQARMTQKSTKKRKVHQNKGI